MTDEQLLRFEELETKARDEFSSSSDFDVTAYLSTEEEIKEYNVLLKIAIKEKYL